MECIRCVTKVKINAYLSINIFHKLEYDLWAYYKKILSDEERLSVIGYIAEFNKNLLIIPVRNLIIIWKILEIILTKLLTYFCTLPLSSFKRDYGNYLANVSDKCSPYSVSMIFK
jgi:hypothetical protein